MPAGTDGITSASPSEGYSLISPVFAGTSR